MNAKISIALICVFSFTTTICHPKEKPPQKIKSIKFTIHKFNDPGLKKKIKDIHIETIKIKKSHLINSTAAKKITHSLQNLSWELYSEAKDWCPPPHDGPWEYDVKFYGVYYTEEILSVVFNNFIACYGNPTINKITKNCIISNGNEATPMNLAEKFSPSLFKSRVFENNNFIELSEDAVDFVLSENASILTDDIKEDCKEYLKKSSYSIWIEPGYLMLQPQFFHPLSICQKTFSIKF